ncbi:adenosine-phosphate deaminase [Aureococcus anophagefferens]|nr:adenosine-phosphate deaminase [Aureococcus anophagefferens]
MSSALHLSCQEDGEDENVLQDCMPTEEDLQRVVFKQFHELDVGGRCAVPPPPVPGYESDSPTASPRSIGRVAPPPLSPPGRAEPGGDDASPEDLSGSPRPAATPAETAALFQVPDIPLYASDSGKTFQRVHIDEADDATEGEDVHVGAAKIKRALDLHLEWTASERRVGQAKRAAPPPSPKRDGYRREPPAYQPLDAYHHAVHPSAESMSATRLRRQTRPTPSLRDFALAFDEIKGIVNAGPVKSLAFKRLAVLEQRFNLHVLLNGWRELSSQKSVPHRDFYNVRKVDTHVHHGVEIDRRAGTSRPNFEILELGQFEVDSADFWDESMALIEFSKHGRRGWSKPFDYAHIEVGVKI